MIFLASGVERRQQGVAAVEMAILSFLLVMILIGIFNFGLAIHRYDSLVKATRTGIRYLSMESDPASKLQEMRNLIRCGSTSGGPACDRIPGLTDQMIGIEIRSRDAQELVDNLVITDLITVKIVDYRFSFSIPFVPLGEITFGDIKSQMVGV